MDLERRPTAGPVKEPPNKKRVPNLVTRIYIQNSEPLPLFASIERLVVTNDDQLLAAEVNAAV